MKLDSIQQGAIDFLGRDVFGLEMQTSAQQARFTQSFIMSDVSRCRSVESRSCSSEDEEVAERDHGRALLRNHSVDSLLNHGSAARSQSANSRDRDFAELEKEEQQI